MSASGRIAKDVSAKSTPPADGLVADQDARIIARAPVSSAQGRLWYMSQLLPGNPYYNVTIAIRLLFAVDVRALRLALSEVVARHEILRTRYTLEDGKPLQEIIEANRWTMTHVLDLNRSTQERERVIARFTQNGARETLNIERTPPFHARLLTLAQDDHVLLLLTHHIATDQRSINLMIAEIEKNYEFLIDPSRCGPGEVDQTIQYREFVRWEVDQLSRHGEELKAYWSEQLKDAEFLPLPSDRVPRASSERLGGELRFQFTSEVTSKLRLVCRRAKATDFMGLFAIWAMLLYRYAGRQSFLIATTTAFRQVAAFDRTLGCFINTLAICLQIEPKWSFHQLLCDVRRRLLDAFDHGGYPYEKQIEVIRNVSSGLGEELVNAYIQFQPRALILSRETVRRFVPNINVHNGRAKFPLMLNVSDRGDCFDGTFEYDRNLFSQSRIREIVPDLLEGVKFVCQDPLASIELFRPKVQIQPSSPTGQTLAPRHAVQKRTTSGLTATEAGLAELWRELLSVKPTQCDDDFLMMGGHSLLVAQLAWWIRKSYFVDVRIADLQRASRLDAMAELIEATPRVEPNTSGTSTSGVVEFDGVPCQLDLGVWRLDDIDKLIASLSGPALSAGERVLRAAWAFKGTPFLFESRRPLPLPGLVPVRLSAFDCVTFVYTALALALSKSMGDFVRTLRALRYREPDERIVDSDPESGTIFDFVEESLILNGIQRKYLIDVTHVIAGGTDLEMIECKLLPQRRGPGLDPRELWATPKFAPQTICLSMLPSSSFDCLTHHSVRGGDLILMSRGMVNLASVIDHVGFAHVENGEVYLLQATRHFALHRAEAGRVEYTGIFYDRDRRREQIGVGIVGHYAGEETAFLRDGIWYYGYTPGKRRPLGDYLKGAGFRRIMVLRPVL